MSISLPFPWCFLRGSLCRWTHQYFTHHTACDNKLNTTVRSAWVPFRKQTNKINPVSGLRPWLRGRQAYPSFHARLLHFRALAVSEAHEDWSMWHTWWNKIKTTTTKNTIKTLCDFSDSSHQPIALPFQSVYWSCLPRMRVQRSWSGLVSAAPRNDTTAAARLRSSGTWSDPPRDPFCRSTEPTAKWWWGSWPGSASLQ